MSNMPDDPSHPIAADNFLVGGVGASAGGLDACRKLVRALPANTGMAFVLIQHLDPTHESLIADLLADQTALVVRQARDGEKVEPNHLYVIPPGTYLAIQKGLLHLSPPLARHGARLPIDFFFQSLAEDCGSRAVAIILSGTGADGSIGLKAIKQYTGLVIAQDPEEASYDGMSRSAIRTGAVDLVLGVGAMPMALRNHAVEHNHAHTRPPANDEARAGIIKLLRAKTPHDFTLYKHGTLERRIARRMVIAAIQPQTMTRYLELLRKDDAELEQLSKDLLINVTSFFRDPAVFQLLADQIIPELVATQQPDRPIRVWLAGCSTGEEAYSLVILFREYMVASGRAPKLQFFASDLDADAIVVAREGLYPKMIARAK